MTKYLDLEIDGFEGSVKVKALRNVDRIGLLGKLGLDHSKLALMAGENAEAKIDMDMIAKMISIASKMVKEVDLKNDDLQYNSWDDLDYDPNAMPIQMEVVNVLLGIKKK